MPTLNIEGRKVKVDDSFLKLSPADQQSTVEEIASQLGIKAAPQDAPVSGMFDQFVSGLDQPLEDIGTTMELTGMPDAGKAVRDFTTKPDNFVSASSRVANPVPGDSYVDPVLGIGWGNVPGAVAEQLGGYAGLMASRAAGGAAGGMVTKNPYGVVAGAVAGPALFSFARQLGPSVLKIAENDGRGPDELTWKDWSQAAATAGVSGALDAIGIGKIGFLNSTVKEVGKKTATEVVKGAVKETGKKALQEGVTEAGQSVVEQFGTSVGTKTGAKVDLKDAFAEGVIGAGAGGTIDAARNAYPTVSTAMDIRSVDSSMRNNPDAQAQAEITRDVNDIAGRMEGSGKAPLSQEVNRYTSDLKRQIKEVIDGQNLDLEDKKALKGGMQDATGLTQDRLDEIAGRSENPSEIKALARKIQVIRETTMQRQTAKGLRGAVASAAYNLGAPIGAAVGDMVSSGFGGSAAGGFIGDRIGTGIARKLRGNQTQGNAIDSLVGKKQARRAAMLLDRYGPSEATTALNTLSEKAAANKAQAEADAQAKADFEETMSRIRFANTLREKSRRAMEQATTKEEKAKAAEAKQKLDLATREERLKGLAFRSQINQARAQKLVQDMEAKKSLNALTIEMAQTRKDLKEAEAVAKADKLNRDADFAVKNLSGKLEMLAIDIQRRQQALKKAEIATKRAEKMANKAPTAAGPTLSRIRNMNSKWAQSVQADDAIINKPAYQSAVQYLDTLRQEAQNEIKAEPNESVRNLLRETLTDLISLKNNWEARRERFARAMQQAKEIGGSTPQKLRDTLYQIAHYKAPEGGREDFGPTPDTSQDIPF